jgi:exosortase
MVDYATGAATASPISGNAPSTDPWTLFRAPILGGAVLLLMLFWLFNDFFIRQLKWAIEHQEDWGHTLVIPFIAGYFVYLERARLMRNGFRTTWIGLAPIIIGIAAYMVCTFGPTTLHHHNYMAVGVSITLFGLALLFCGWRAMLFLWFPLAYLCLFGQTISERFLNIVTFKMQDITARGSEVFMTLLFLDVERKSNTLYLYNDGVAMPLNIAEACSGMRMLMAFLALGVAMAFVGLRRAWQRILLVLLAVPTAIFVNILRVTTLALLTKINPALAEGDVHTFIGMLWLIPAFFIYLGIQWVIKKLVIEETAALPSREPEVVRNPFDSKARLALIVSVATIVLCAGGSALAVRQLNIVLQKSPVDMREPFQTIPRQLGAWEAQGKDELLGKAIIEELGTDKYLNRRYIRTVDGVSAVLSLHCVYYTGMIDAVPHVPDRCWVAGGGLRPLKLPTNEPLPLDATRLKMSEPTASIAQPGVEFPRAMTFHPVLNTPIWVHLPSGESEFRTSVFTSDQYPDVRIYGGYVFVANGAFTPSPDGVRRLAFDRTSKYAYYAKIQVQWFGDEKSTQDQFLGHVSDLMTELLPEFMRCLPDWPTVESTGTTTTAAPVTE